MKDFILSISSAIAVCGHNISKGYQIKLKKQLQDKPEDFRVQSNSLKFKSNFQQWSIRES